MIDFQIKIAGAAGEGVMVLGNLIAKALSRAGLYVFNYSEYPSLIKGGHNTATVRASENKIGSLFSKIEILVSLNNESFQLHEDEITPGGILIWDERNQKKLNCLKEVHCIHIPLKEMALKLGNPIVQNTIALGASAASINFSFEYIKKSLAREFAKKGQNIVDLNQKAAKLGFDFIKRNYKGKTPADLSKLIEAKEDKPLDSSQLISARQVARGREDKDKVVMTGNEAIALGAIAAGCGFYAGYPMTPSTGIFHQLAALESKTNLIFKQTEDEISAINMALGASFAGVRAMTSTSGGGFALMTEAVGLAAMVELPLVIAEVMRPGPATGMPTWTEQGDLRQVLHGGQGDYPKIVLTPGDIDESMDMTILAFNLADEFQLPVIILSDKYLAESYMSASWPSADQKNQSGLISDAKLKTIKNYQRYKISENGISPRSIPGQADGMHRANSDEHDQFGFSSENSENRQLMMEKRMRKIEHIRAHLPHPESYGENDQEVTVFGFGSTKWLIREAVDLLKNDKIKAKAVHLPIIWPFPAISVSRYWEQAKTNIIVENNFSGQLEGLIRQETGLFFDESLRKFDGRPFLAEEIAEDVKRKI